MLDERARALLDYVDPRDLTLILKMSAAIRRAAAPRPAQNPSAVQNLGTCALTCTRFRSRRDFG